MRIVLCTAPAVFLFSVVCMNPLSAWADEYTHQLAERDAVQKGVDFLVHGSVDWVRKHGCFACHANGLGAFVTGLSSRNGYVVNQHEYDTNARFVSAHPESEGDGDAPDGHQPIGTLACQKCHFIQGGNRKVSLTAVIGTGLAFGGQSVSKGYAEQTGNMAQLLLDVRSEKGKWTPDYQSPVIITGDVMTSALCAVMLKESASLVPDGNEFSKAIRGWHKSLDTSALTKTADIAFALLGTASSGAGGSDVNGLETTLFELQNSDGGWPAQQGEESNIIATGQTLLAFAAGGLSRDEPHVGAAIDFLSGRQREDGTWVPVGEGKDYGKFPQTYTRTAWAIAGLSSILDMHGLLAKRSEVIRELEHELRDGQDDEKLHRLARALLLLQDAAGAVKTYEQLIARSPQMPTFRLELARTYLSTGDRKKAAAAYQEALKTDLPTDTRVSVLLTTAECLEEMGENKDAAAIYLQLANPKGPLPLARSRRLLSKVVALDTDPKLWSRYGIVTEWEVCGPYPNEGDDGFTKAHAPEKGEQSPWQKFVSDDPAGLLDLSEATKEAKDTCGYARLRVSSPAEQQAQLRLGSDGSVAVWLNGKEVHRKQAARAIAFDQDKVDVTIPKGRSTLIVKVGQNKENGRLVFRLTDRNGEPLNDVER